jgi:hypothetical protein
MPKKSQKPKLSGERLAWYELAYHLHMTVDDLKEKITPSDFEEWHEFLQMQRERDDKLHFYLAQIACETRRSYIKHPSTAKLRDFLLKFATPESREVMSEAHRQHLIAMSKGAWLARVGLKVPGVNAPS